VAPSGECLQGDGWAYLIGQLATERRLYLAAYSPMLNLVVAAGIKIKLIIIISQALLDLADCASNPLNTANNCRLNLDKYINFQPQNK